MYLQQKETVDNLLEDDGRSLLDRERIVHSLRYDWRAGVTTTTFSYLHQQKM